MPTSLTNSSTMCSSPRSPMLDMLCDLAMRDLAKRDFNLGPPPPPKKKQHFRGWMTPVPYPLASPRPSPRPRPSLPLRGVKTKTKTKAKAKQLSDYLKPGFSRYPAVASAREKRLERRRMMSGK